MSRTWTVAWVVFAVLGVAALGPWSAVGNFTFFVDHPGRGTSASMTSAASSAALARSGLNLDGSVTLDTPVAAMAFTPDGKTLAVRLRSGVVQLRDPVTAAVRATVGPVNQSASDYTSSLAISPNGQDVAIGITSVAVNSVPVVDVISIATGKVTASLRLGDHEAYGLAYSQDGRTIGIAADSAFIVWNLATDTTISVATDQGDSAYISATRVRDLFAVASNEGGVRLWNVADTEITRTLAMGSSDESRSYGITAAAISPDGTTVALGGNESGTNSAGFDDDTGAPGTWLLYPATGKTAQLGTSTLQTGNQDGVSAVAFSPDGTLLATGDDNGTIKLWNVATGKLVSAKSAPSTISGIGAIAFAPDGDSVVSVQNIDDTAGEGTAVLQSWDPKPVSGATTPALAALPPGVYPVNRSMPIDGGLAWALTLRSVQVATNGTTTVTITVENTGTTADDLVCDNSQRPTGAAISLSNGQVLNASSIYCPEVPAGTSMLVQPHGTVEFDTVFATSGGLGKPFSFYWDGPGWLSSSLSDISLSR
jgi:WD40 repeat protein